jgi:hypothetical protein
MRRLSPNIKTILNIWKEIITAEPFNFKWFFDTETTIYDTPSNAYTIELATTETPIKLTYRDYDRIANENKLFFSMYYIAPVESYPDGEIDTKFMIDFPLVKPIIIPNKTPRPMIADYFSFTRKTANIGNIKDLNTPNTKQSTRFKAIKQAYILFNNYVKQNHNISAIDRLMGSIKDIPEPELLTSLDIDIYKMTNSVNFLEYQAKFADVIDANVWGNLMDT